MIPGQPSKHEHHEKCECILLSPMIFIGFLLSQRLHRAPGNYKVVLKAGCTLQDQVLRVWRAGESRRRSRAFAAVRLSSGTQPTAAAGQMDTCLGSRFAPGLTTRNKNATRGSWHRY